MSLSSRYKVELSIRCSTGPPASLTVGTVVAPTFLQ